MKKCLILFLAFCLVGIFAVVGFAGTITNNTGKYEDQKNHRFMEKAQTFYIFGTNEPNLLLKRLESGNTISIEDLKKVRADVTTIIIKDSNFKRIDCIDYDLVNNNYEIRNYNKRIYVGPYSFNQEYVLEIVQK